MELLKSASSDMKPSEGEQADIDNQRMHSVLQLAKIALKKENYPVAAMLVIDGEESAISINNLNSHHNWIGHAEHNILIHHSTKIKQSKLHCDSYIELYTNLEPCLMCFGTAVLHRIDRIVYGAPDPNGGASDLTPLLMSEWYQRRWPKVVGGVLADEAYDLMMEFYDRKQQSDPNWSPQVKRDFMRSFQQRMEGLMIESSKDHPVFKQPNKQKQHLPFR